MDSAVGRIVAQCVTSLHILRVLPGRRVEARIELKGRRRRKPSAATGVATRTCIINEF